jgi:hypothetical protein
MGEERWSDWQRQVWEKRSAAMEKRPCAAQVSARSRQLRAKNRILRLARHIDGANPLTVAITDIILVQRGLLEPKRFTPLKTSSRVGCPPPAFRLFRE